LGIQKTDLRNLIIKPTLRMLDMGGEDAIMLLLRTAAAESSYGRSLDQDGGGPGRSPWQLEPATVRDICENYARHRSLLWQRLHMISGGWPMMEEGITGNLYLACAFARLVYYRAKGPLPDALDIEGQAAYWKQHYNTPLGKGTIAHFMKATA
jgi:hypothetical protein